MFDAPNSNSDATPSARTAPFGLSEVITPHQYERTDATGPAIVVNSNASNGRSGEDLIVEGLLAARFDASGRGLASLSYVEIGVDPPHTGTTYLFYWKYGASGVL